MVLGDFEYLAPNRIAERTIEHTDIERMRGR